MTLREFLHVLCKDAGITELPDLKVKIKEKSRFLWTIAWAYLVVLGEWRPLLLGKKYVLVIQYDAAGFFGRCHSWKCQTKRRVNRILRHEHRYRDLIGAGVVGVTVYNKYTDQHERVQKTPAGRYRCK